MEMINSKNLFGALSKVQGSVKAAHKSSENPFFKSRFADLESVIESLQAPMNDNGIAILFEFKTEMVGDNPANWMRYILTHSSGENYISQWMMMMMKDKTPQGFGASCTYYKRQMLKAVFNVPETDDDGNSQSQATQIPQKPASAIKPAAPKPQNMAPGAGVR